MTIVRPFIIGNFKRLVMGRGVKKLPLIAGHKLLYTCNLRCKMCPFWRRKDENLLSVDKEVEMMKSLQRVGVLFMGFEGGEPLLRRDLPQILEESHRRFYTSIVTNGWLLKDRFREIRDYVDYMFVSIDGIGEVHDKIRGIPGSFEKAISGIKEAKRISDMPIALSFTLTSENIDQAIPVVDLARNLGVKVSVQIAYNYSTAEKISPEKEKLKIALKELLELKKKDYPIIESAQFFEAILNSWYRGIGWKCKPWITINIDPQGRIVLPCYVLNEYYGEKKVWEVNLIDLWNSYPWEKYESCNSCGLACYLEPSLFSMKNPSMFKEKILNNLVSYITS
ncbi:Fe-S oxidoreductase [Candidatus Acidianus copahuensis]|uniref:Fe-S oxidoreductase n=1 Tax=Candidatus Acidianus copahuensis TaxID=1160895 RepID=A0A031LNB6_9CREN|nr:PTO1314 family radical SAM protein [Candidatus Acidianus copahuensis]EZQ04905.1 Fe-S oxidoreductase [Candidatus Acidianus copahuensis]